MSWRGQQKVQGVFPMPKPVLRDPCAFERVPFRCRLHGYEQELTERSREEFPDGFGAEIGEGERASTGTGQV